MQYLESSDLKVFLLVTYKSTLWCGVTGPQITCGVK